MFTKSIGDRWRNANRRVAARDVRVHPDAGQVPSPAKHRAPARGAATALHQIKAEAPTTPKPLPDAFRFESFALGWMDDDIARMRLDAAAKEQRANQLLGEATRLRTAADTWERLRRIADVFTADEPPAPQAAVDPQTPAAVAGDVCSGCKRSRDTLLCFSALEGRDVALCPRCHPSADDVDDAGADGEEPERVEPTTAHPGSCCCAHCESEAYKDSARAQAEPQRPADVELPESMTPDAVPAPVDGPAAVPSMDPAIAEAAKGAYSYVVPAMARRATPDPTNGDADTAQLRRVGGGSR